MLNRQLAPRGYLIGLGDALGEFQNLYATDPNVRSKWDTIAAQLQSEGADPSDINAAKQDFANAFDQLSQATTGMTGDQAVAAAQQYVQAGHTIAGMAYNITALVNNSGSTPPGTALQAVGGTLVGFAVLAGSLSAGVGAAIVAGIALVGEALNALFGGGSPGVEICPGVHCNPAPQWAITCTCAYGTPDNPGTNAWKNFPDPTKSEDSDWYTKTGVQNWPASQSPSARITVWGSLQSGLIATANAPLVVQAFFPMWHLMCEQQGVQPGAVGDFQRAFFSAWKANAAYAINGLKKATDTQVLIHTARIWNRTHEPGTGYDFQPSSAQVETYPIFNITSGWSSSTGRQLQTPSSSFAAPCPVSLDPYEAILVGGGDPTLQAGQANFQGSLAAATDSNILNGQALHIHTGPLKSAGVVAGTSQIKPASKAAPVVAAGAAAGLIGTVAYSYLTGRTIDLVATHAWRKIAGLFRG